MKISRRSLAKRTAVTLIYLTMIASVFLTLYTLGSRIRTRSVPVGSIELSTHYSTYLVGQEVTFTVKNNFNSTVYITNNCPSEPLEVYRLENQKWARIHDTAQTKDCAKGERQVAIPANGSRNGSFAEWPNLFNKAGTYRIVAYVDYYNLLPYQDFTVIDKPAVPEIPALLPTPTYSSSSSSNTSATSAASSSNTNTNTNTTPTQTPAEPEAKTQTISIDQGSISVSYIGSVITVLSITPASGCSKEGGRSGTQVEVTFKCGGSETQIQLRVVNGQIDQRVEQG